MAYALAKPDIFLKALQQRLPTACHVLRTRVNFHYLESQEVRVTKNFRNNFCNDPYPKCMEMRIDVEE